MSSTDSAAAADFSTTTFGKFILSGEHSVLRGAPALVFPVKSKTFEVKWRGSSQSLAVNFSGPFASDIEIFFWAAMERALKLAERNRNELKGQMDIIATVPIGAGLGASASICVALGKFFIHQDWVSNDQLYEFARNLENLFHGESSGVDIAVNIQGEGIRFNRGGEWGKLELMWQPNWRLSYSGERGVTSDCVKKVKSLGDRDPKKFEALDQQMAEASNLAEKSLVMERAEGLSQLTKAFNKAGDCFSQWGLVTAKMESHMKALCELGALAVKPTGSGGGGYILSLWPDSVTPDDVAFLQTTFR